MKSIQYNLLTDRLKQIIEQAMTFFSDNYKGWDAIREDWNFERFPAFVESYLSEEEMDLDDIRFFVLWYADCIRRIPDMAREEVNDLEMIVWRNNHDIGEDSLAINRESSDENTKGIEVEKDSDLR